MVDSKSFIKYDIIILVSTAAHFAVSQGSINSTYSSGYDKIWIFFLAESLIQLLFQLLLVIADLRNSKLWVLSLRSGSLFFMLGMSFILLFLGLFSLWLIAFVAICGYL